MKNNITKILFPNAIIGFSCFNLGFGLLIYIFSTHLENTPLAYISYILSFYGLIIFCIWFYKMCKFSNESIKKSKLYHLYQTHFLTTIKVNMYCSLILNFLIGMIKLGIGVYYRSWWFTTFAIYYLSLCFMKLSLVKNINNKEKEYRKQKHTGVTLLLLNFILIGIILLIIKQNHVINYNRLLIYALALYDFYLIINSVINVIKYRKNNNPIIASSKCINLTVAMISMISLEVAMIDQFGTNDSSFKFVMTTSMGFVICLINSFMAIYMIMRASRNLKK